MRSYQVLLMCFLWVGTLIGALIGTSYVCERISGYINDNEQLVGPIVCRETGLHDVLWTYHADDNGGGKVYFFGLTHNDGCTRVYVEVGSLLHKKLVKLTYEEWEEHYTRDRYWPRYQINYRESKRYPFGFKLLSIYEVK